MPYSKHFDFFLIGRQFCTGVFEVPLDVYDSEFRESYSTAHHRALLPQNVQSMLKEYTEQAYTLFVQAIDACDGLSTDLCPFIVPPSYGSAAAAVLGKRFPAEKSMPYFRTFDNTFPLIAAGLPRIFTRKGRKAWARVLDILEEYLAELEDDDDIPELIRVALDCTREAKWVRLLSLYLFLVFSCC